MARQSPLRFVLSLGLEVALVVAIVSVLPRIDLSGGRETAPSPAGSAAAGTRLPSLDNPEVSLAGAESLEPAGAAPRMTPIAALPARPAAPWTLVRDTLANGDSDRQSTAHAPASEPPRLINPDAETDRAGSQANWQPAKPEQAQASAGESQYAEQRLDRASQALLNGLGSYVARAAGELFQPSEPASDVRAAASLQSTSPSTTAEASAAQPTTASSYIARSPTIADQQALTTVPPPAAAPSFPTVAPAANSATAPQIVFPSAGSSSPPTPWTGSFQTQSAPPVARPATPPAKSFRAWRNY